MNATPRRSRLGKAALGLVTALALSVSLTGASAASAAPQESSEAAACLVIVEQGEKPPTSFNRWAKVHNECGRDIALVTVQLDYHVDPTCTPIAAGGYAVYSWIVTPQENALATYAYECPGP
ncbi:hypothetical protein [Streptomyces sp. NPDC054863]